MLQGLPKYPPSEDKWAFLNNCLSSALVDNVDPFCITAHLHGEKLTNIPDTGITSTEKEKNRSYSCCTAYYGMDVSQLLLSVQWFYIIFHCTSWILSACLWNVIWKRSFFYQISLLNVSFELEPYVSGELEPWWGTITPQIFQLTKPVRVITTNIIDVF